MQADPGQTNGLATAALVVLITAVVIGVIIAIVAVSVNQSHKTTDISGVGL